MIRHIELKVRLLTPLHIGTGTILTEGFDYVTHNGRTYRLDLDVLAEELYTRDPRLIELLLKTPPGQLLKPEELRPDAPFIRYVLPGVPSGQHFREAIKDPYDRPYIPGSSLKGALRTVIAWHAWKELGLSLASVRLGQQAKFASKDLEAEIFGKDPEKGTYSPNHDLLKAFRISDSHPVDAEALGIYQVKVWTRRGGAAPISVEAIKPGTEIAIEASVDENLFSEWASKAPGFPLRHKNWIDSLPQLARKRAAERLKCEIGFWEEAGYKELFYGLAGQIKALNKESTGFPLQLGFGTGWEGTTIGAPLKEDPEWPKVYRRYPMGINPKTKRRTPPQEYPRSRRVVVNKQGKPAAPLGWVWVQWKEA